MTLFSSFLETVQSHAEKQPQKLYATYVSPVEPPQDLNFAELLDGGYRYAAMLKNKGIKKGEVVPVILQNSPELATAFVGVLLVGALPTIISPPSVKISPDRYVNMMVAMIKRTKARILITERGLQEQYLPLFKKRELRLLMVVPDKLMQCETSNIKKKLYARFEEPLFLQHSSGTTGLQKGVAISNGALVRQLNYLAQLLELRKTKDRIVSWLPLYHDMGLIACFLFPMYHGIHTVQIKTFDWLQYPHLLFDSVTQYQASLCWLPNFAYSFLANRAKEKKVKWNLASLRMVINCSEPIGHKAHEDFSNRFASYQFSKDALSTSYAMAENVFAVSQHPPEEKLYEISVDQNLFRKGQIVPCNNEGIILVSSGKIISGTCVKIIDKHGEILPRDQVGEIVISGDCVIQKYFNNSKATKEAIQNGEYRTGDLGFFHGDHLFVTGRKKDLIIVGGHNIYPQDVELPANESKYIHPGRVVAFGVYDDERGTDSVVLIAERKNEGDLSDQEIENDLRKLITQSGDVALDRVIIVKRNWLLKSTSGKISRSLNREKAKKYGYL